MTAGADAATETLAAAERIARLLASAGIDSAIIGAVALAAHNYPRSTEDLDLAVGVEPGTLADIARELRAEGFTAEVSEPDQQDPLGGVVRVSADGIDPIEIVNFKNPPAGGIPALVDVALRDALPYREGSGLRVVRLSHLIAFKLYSGGLKSKTDVLELLSRNPELDLDELRETCARFRLDGKLETWLQELATSSRD